MLEHAADDLWDASAVTEIEARIHDADAEAKVLLRERAGMLAAAQRFGVVGAYAYAQGFGRSARIPRALVDALGQALRSQAALEDLLDQHPILIRLYRQFAKQDPHVPLPPGVPNHVQAAAQALLQRRDVDPSTVNAHLHPGLRASLHAQRGEVDAALRLFTPHRFPIDHGEMRLQRGRALLAQGRPGQALVELEAALPHLDVEVRADELLMAVAPRSEAEIRALQSHGRLLIAEAWLDQGHADTAWRIALALEEELDPATRSARRWAAEAALTQARAMSSTQSGDRDQRVRRTSFTCCCDPRGTNLRRGSRRPNASCSRPFPI